MCVVPPQGFAGRQAGESSRRVDGQEVLQRYVGRVFPCHVHLDPGCGQSYGVQHRDPARAEDGDPGEQSHRHAGEGGREIGKTRPIYNDEPPDCTLFYTHNI